MIVILYFFIGLVVGYLIRNFKSLLKLADKLSEYMVFLLIFLLGFSVGGNDKIINNLSSLGIAAFVIVIGGMLGSLSTAKLVGKIFFKEDSNEK
jgi:uncharacterized membrane protein YbjE (DUF340 family)